MKTVSLLKTPHKGDLPCLKVLRGSLTLMFQEMHAKAAARTLHIQETELCRKVGSYPGITKVAMVTNIWCAAAVFLRLPNSTEPS